MLLITAAHKNEVKPLLSTKPFQKVEANFYLSGQICVVISGEGAENVRKCCRHIERLFPNETFRLLNIGVAGSLSEKYKPGEIVILSQVSVELSGDRGGVLFLKNVGQGVKCVSALMRVENAEYAKQLGAKGDVVDRELWYWADWAIGKGIDCQSIKIISDRASEFPGTAEVLQHAAKLSERLTVAVRNLPEWKE